jgi:xanthine dehydrogenase accessory factor
VPAGLDLGSTSHQEIAVAILAELVQLRADGTLSTGAPPAVAAAPAEAADPVCGMTVTASPDRRPLSHDGTTYYFCSAGCRRAFEAEPAAYAKDESRC